MWNTEKALLQGKVIAVASHKEKKIREKKITHNYIISIWKAFMSNTNIQRHRNKLRKLGMILTKHTPRKLRNAVYQTKIL